MNVKRWFLASLAAFVVISALDWLAHMQLLKGLYGQTSALWRPQAQAIHICWLMKAGTAFFAGLFTFIYDKGYEAGKPGLGQGLRYGFLIGLLISAPYVTIWYVVLPIPFKLALGWVASGMVDCLAAGAVAGLIYRP
ncbi:MAG: hypothetical protein HY211_03755 [Candidatus Omnitrophica bacterium]|nr:hypothetical protein [Candidatus Omnitrophota bacterium]